MHDLDEVGEVAENFARWWEANGDNNEPQARMVTEISFKGESGKGFSFHEAKVFLEPTDGSMKLGELRSLAQSIEPGLTRSTSPTG